MKISREFYNRDTLLVAKELLGKVLVNEVSGVKLSGKIVEVEAYKGYIDKAAHAYNGKRTPRIEVMYGNCGFAYVYFIYGLYYCMNVVTKEEGVAEAVLIRALEPLEGLEEISQNRFKKDYKHLKSSEIKNLTNGPSKLCMALNINKECNALDLCGEKLYIEQGDKKEFIIKEAKRIGIDYAEEAKDYLWRFYIDGNKYVSKI